MRKLIVANWKENPKTERQALRLFWGTTEAEPPKAVKVVVCPPVVYLEPIAKQFRALKSKSQFALGAQDVFWEEAGAFTSEIGPSMLKSFGIRYVTIGHSERRKFLHETDAMVNKKVIAALKVGLSVILCVGEPLSVRKKGVPAAQRFVGNQLKKDLKGVGHDTGNLIIAYEPIWAIGSGKNDPPEDAANMARFIKKELKASIPVLYGGSVNGKNASDYLNVPEIDGALVGGASLKSKEFAKIIAF